VPKHVVDMQEIVRIDYRIMQLLLLQDLSTSSQSTE
jgi:hypothetical protein